MPYVVLKINFAFIIDLEDHKNFRVGRKAGGHSVQPPIFKGAPTNENQMTFSTDYFQMKCQMPVMQPKTS